jgi:restriction system protein
VKTANQSSESTKAKFTKPLEKNYAVTAWTNQRSNKMRFLKFNGVLREIAERYPNVNLIWFLQEELKLPDYKAEELAARIEKQYFQKTTNETEQKPVKVILEKPSKSELPNKASVYSVDSLSDNEFEHFIRWLLEELGYAVQPEKYEAALGFDLVTTKDDEKIVIQARKYPKNCKVSKSILLMSQIAKQTYGCQRSIVLATVRFTQQTDADAQKLGVELWDSDTLTNKIKEVKAKTELEEQSIFPKYNGSLLQSLLQLDETEHFIIEPKAGGKYDLHLPSVKYPLLTFQVKSNSVTRCVCRIKNNKPVTENEGTALISIDRSNNRVGPDDMQVYVLVIKYLEKFLE